MDFVTSVTNTVSLLWDPIARRVRYMTRLEENVRSLTNAKEDLIDARNDVRARVDAAEGRGLNRTNEVIRWLERVQDTEGEVTEIEAAFNQRRCLGDPHLNCWSSYKLGKKVSEKLVYVSELKTQGAFRLVAEESLSNRGTLMPTTSTAGMDLPMEKVLSCLGQDEVGVIGIFGIGGVGKTTLLKQINNELLQSGDFDVVIWIVVSIEPNVSNIRKVIGQKLSLPDDQDLGAEDILNVLSGKRFMLLLDDLWARLDLQEVGIPHPNSQNRCKLIFSTRSKAVCGEMEAHEEIKVECLAPKEAWNLFVEQVGEETIYSHLEIQKLAEEVAEKCYGLPLALITIGQAMVGKTTPEEWEEAITVLSESMSNFQGMKDKVFPLLKFSYDNLGDDTMRSCFLYCCLYPEHFHIERDELIDYWIGEGFLDECYDLDEARNYGHYLIGRLKAACLLEDGDNPETEVKMHKVIRDLALWITCDYGLKKNKILVEAPLGFTKARRLEKWKEAMKNQPKADEFLVGAPIGLTKAPILEKWGEAMRIFLTDNQLKGLIEAPICPNLLTMIVHCSQSLRTMPWDFFHFMPLLRVLDLSQTQLQQFPMGIGELDKLKYLNLANTQFRVLHIEIGNLVELQHFDLSRAKIVGVPEAMVKLVKLNNLDLSHTMDLKTIPPEVIAGLSRLQVLNLCGSRYSSWKVGASDDDKSVVDLAELEGLKQLNVLGISISNFNALNKFARSQILTKCTRYLKIQISNALTCLQLSSSYGNMKRLQLLRMYGCHELEELIIDAGVEGENQLLPSLEELDLNCLPKLKTILVPHGCLQNLCFIHINLCPGLKNVTWVIHLQSLQEIDLIRCEGLEEVIGGEVEALARDLIDFPRLKSIRLAYLPELKSICRHALSFPSLQFLDVRDCPKLKQLSFGHDSINKTSLKIEGQKQWWDGLEWDDESIKSTFLPYFNEAKISESLRPFQAGGRKGQAEEENRRVADATSQAGGEKVQAEEENRRVADATSQAVGRQGRPKEENPRAKDAATLKKVVMSFTGMTDAKTKNKAMKAASRIDGLDSVSLDKEDQTMTLIGENEMNVVDIVRKLRKFGADLISVGPLPAKQVGKCHYTRA